MLNQLVKRSNQKIDFLKDRLSLVRIDHWDLLVKIVTTKNRFEDSRPAGVGTMTITWPERDAMTAVNVTASRIFLYFLLPPTAKFLFYFTTSKSFDTS